MLRNCQKFEGIIEVRTSTQFTTCDVAVYSTKRGRGTFMDVLLEQVVFSIGADSYRWQDVVLSAQLRGDWAVLEKRLREGFACLGRLNDLDEELESTEVETAANEFRYERDLVTAAETEAWLKQWHLNAEAWMEYVRRSLLRQKWAAQLAEMVARYPVGQQSITENLYAEAVCSGAFRQGACRQGRSLLYGGHSRVDRSRAARPGG